MLLFHAIQPELLELVPLVDLPKKFQDMLLFHPIQTELLELVTLVNLPKKLHDMLCPRHPARAS